MLVLLEEALYMTSGTYVFLSDNVFVLNSELSLNVVITLLTFLLDPIVFI